MSDESSVRGGRGAAQGAGDRARSIVLGWLRHLSAEAGPDRPLVLLEPSAPEASLLRAWCAQGGLPLQSIEPREGAPGDPTLLHACHRLAAERPGAIPVSIAHRMRVLLDPLAPAVLPFGDLSASRLLDWAGGLTLPPGVSDVETLCRLERSIEAGLRSHRLRAALREAWGDEAGARWESRLIETARFHRGPRLPKLEDWTPGIDPPLG